MTQKTYNVVVAGAGVAGIAAAVQAAREGAKTALVEKLIITGGLATAGLVNLYLPLCDGYGTQVTFGLPEELLRLSTQYGPGQEPATWRANNGVSNGNRFRLQFNPASFALALDQLLLDSGVDLWFDTVVIGTLMSGRRVCGLEVHNKSGRIQLHADCVVDATGDAEISQMAGAATMEGSNVAACWAIAATPESSREHADSRNGASLVNKLVFGRNPAKVPPPDGTRLYCGVSGRDSSDFVIESRERVRTHYGTLYAEGAGSRNSHFPLVLPTLPDYRRNRCVVGRTTLEEGDADRSFSDSVGLAADWRHPGPVWEIPYGSVVPEGVEGLLTSGRGSSAQGDAWEITRVIPCAALTGQACGMAAAMSSKLGGSPDQLHVRQLQQRLAAGGIPLHRDDVGL